MQYLRDAGLTGFEVVPTKVKFKSWSRQPATFWELIPKGSAGMISSQSGYKVLRVCPACGLIESDTKIDDPTKVIDKSTWDGTDFFRLERVSGWIFVTDRVIQTLRGTPFKGWKAYSLLEMKETFDIAVPGRNLADPY